MSANTNGHNIDNEPGSYEEIEIPVPWGQIRGKWWGEKDCQPILALHGWQDNCGTFDTLAPLLVAEGFSLLCIDFPGHGFSSPHPEGILYYVFWDYMYLVRRIVKHFNWKQLTLLGHSLGGAVAFLYAATYPDDVEKYICLDITSPGVKDLKEMTKIYGDCVDKVLKYETMRSDQNPCYTYEDMKDMILDGYKGSITEESCEILMRRGVLPSKEKKGHYVLTRDARLRVASLGYISTDQTLEFANRITCEHLNIKAEPGLKWDHPEHYDTVLDAIEKNAKRVVRVKLDGPHHLHLNNPERVVGHIIEFLKG